MRWLTLPGSETACGQASAKIGPATLIYFIALRQHTWPIPLSIHSLAVISFTKTVPMDDVYNSQLMTTATHPCDFSQEAAT